MFPRGSVEIGPLMGPICGNTKGVYPSVSGIICKRLPNTGRGYIRVRKQFGVWFRQKHIRLFSRERELVERGMIDSYAIDTTLSFL